MEMSKNDVNLQIGKRLREARLNLNVTKSEFAEVLDVSEEHYRKLEAGKTRLSADKMYILHDQHDIDPDYLILGSSENVKGFDLDAFVANSTKDERDEFIERVLSYIVRIIK